MIKLSKKNGLRIADDMALTRRGEPLFIKNLPEGESKKIHFFSTHFSRKVCTVEFGVILSSLHRFVWKFPLLANRATSMSEKGSCDDAAIWDDITRRTNQLTSHV